MAELRLHLGVHKTGTTYLQRWLDRSEFQPDTIWINEVQSRKFFGNNAPLTDWHAQATNFVISDENLMGIVPNDLKLYPKIFPRLQHFQTAAPKIFLCVRRYSDYFASSWVEKIKRNPYFPFPETIDLAGRGWVQVIEMLQQYFHKSEMTIWTYDDFAGNEHQIAKLIAGNGLKRLGHQPPHPINIRLSVDAVAAIRQRKDSRPATPAKYYQLYPRSATNPAFDPWQDSSRAALDDQFETDWAIIKSRFNTWAPL